MEAIGEILPDFGRKVESAPEQPIDQESTKKTSPSDADSTGKAFWGAACVPKRHKGFKPTDSTRREWTEAYMRASASIGKGGITALLGLRGAGKTQMAACLIRDMCKKGKSARYCKALDIFVELRESFKIEGKTGLGTINGFVTPELLVIDALENRGETEFENRLLSHIIDKRYDSMVDTVLISNQTPAEFSATVGASVVSRIHETGCAIECTWGSFRSQQQAKQEQEVF